MAAPVEYEFEWGPSSAIHGGSPERITPDFSPPLIAMVAVIGTAFLIVIYAWLLSRHIRRFLLRWRRWRRRRRLVLSFAVTSSDIESPPPGGVGRLSSSDYFRSTYGLDDSAIKALPLSLYSKSKAKHLATPSRDCAVCLFEFEDNDSLRTLPSCSHAFHVDCIDVWLRSRASCPLCRAKIFRTESPFVPMRAARIRPSLDDLLFASPEATMPEPDGEITPAGNSPQAIHTEDLIDGRDFLLKRSYSFGFERNLAADRMVMEASTASPWRQRHLTFWRKRWPSPFDSGGGGSGSYSASRGGRAFSFRNYRGVTVKSPFMRRRGFFPLSSERSVRFGGGPSSRRSRSLASPVAIFTRPSGVGFSSSRMRCGDPEALLSPERLNRR